MITYKVLKKYVLNDGTIQVLVEITEIHQEIMDLSFIQDSKQFNIEMATELQKAIDDSDKIEPELLP